MFDPAHKDNCFIDTAVTVDRLTVNTGYAASVGVGTTLTIATPAAEAPKSNWVQLHDPDTYLRGPRPGELLPAGAGTVIMKAGSEFSWQAGRLEKLSVEVQTGAFATVRDTSAPGCRMAYSNFLVDGTLDWVNGAVPVVNPDAAGGSGVTVLKRGVFNIMAPGAYWGSSTPSEFVVQNDGVVNLDAGGTATIRGDYFTSNLTDLQQGILAIKGKAEQSAGLFVMLNRTTVDVSSAVDTTLYILRGNIHGNGIVQGNLSLAKQGWTDFGGGNVVPGWGDDDIIPFIPGTINVSGDFLMWAPGSLVHLTVTNAGQVCALVVAGKVTLTGRLEVQWMSGYKPGAGTQVKFMSWGGQRTGTFQDIRLYTPGTWMDGDMPVSVFFKLPSNDEEVTGFVSPDLDSP